MRALRLLVFVVAAITSVRAASIDHDKVEPFPQPEPVTDAEKAAVKFKPSLVIKGGCHPYPAVNAVGDTNAGLKGTGRMDGDCQGSELGSQVSSRSMLYDDRWAIMYAWYFPKDIASGMFLFDRTGQRHRWMHVVVWLDNPALDTPTILAVSTQTGTERPVERNHLDGTTLKTEMQENVAAGRHQIVTSIERGEFQDLIQWEQMTDEARESLETSDFGVDTGVPFNNAHFESNIKAASTYYIYINRHQKFSEAHSIWDMKLRRKTLAHSCFLPVDTKAMQRPRSDGHRAVRRQSSQVSRSLQFSAGQNGGRIHDSDFNHPRRPKTTPKPRIQRLLPTPGREAIDRREPTALPPSTLTRLPDSPPRSAKESIFQFEPVENLENPSTRFQDTNLKNGDDSRVGNLLEPEQDAGEETQDPNNCPGVSAAGPLSSDIGEQLRASGDDDNDDNDAEYQRELSARARLLDSEASRQRIRNELEEYVGSLNTRVDENGDHLVEFPKNYQQVVALMTQKDVQDDDAFEAEDRTHHSWSRVLIEAGLSKQQAFGVLEDGDDDAEGKGSLAAKIALKMARIRQLDLILEEKLGKDLYANIAPRKPKRTTPPEAKDPTSRTLVTQAQQIGIATAITSNGSESSRSNSLSTARSETSLSKDKDAGAKTSNYFIERNKQVVANGMRANMTRDEESRLEKLLLDEATTDGSTQVPNGAGICPAANDLNGYKMSDAEKKAIDELITVKGSAYPLFAIDELQGDDQLLHPSDSTKDAGSGSTNDNIIQETKKQRLQRQRLSRVEQELRFLQESLSVIIVGDDDDDDDCRSEKSYITVASSTCSTRSGVISRHDFKSFLALQSETFRSTPTASVEEIRRLLLSVNNHATTRPNSVMTATTG